jgi:hypothetical protein
MSTDAVHQAIRKLGVVPGHDEPHRNARVPVGEVLYRREEGAIDRD